VIAEAKQLRTRLSVIDELFDARSRLSLARVQIDSCADRIDELVVARTHCQPSEREQIENDLRRARDKRRFLRDTVARLSDEVLEFERLLMIGDANGA
jgi:predicted lipoprotein